MFVSPAGTNYYQPLIDVASGALVRAGSLNSICRIAFSVMD